jgi:anti-sigma B factor antagonist
MDMLLESGARTIILDLSDVTFVDSSALAVIVRGMKRCRERSGDLILCGLRQPVRIIFELTRMDRAFRIYDSAEAARQALAADAK